MKKVFVALSGGVDSSVVAHKLQNEGWDVTAVFIRVWQPDFLPCTQDEEERAALRVAAALGIPFRRLDLSKEYKEGVVDTMVSEYRAGRTPNPDVLCNEKVKFGAFLSYAKKEGVHKIATGHHAQVKEVDGLYQLLRGADASKDQAYFLWKLTQEELSYTLMPIGEMTKTEIRAYAEKYNIPSAKKPDSQGLCFIGHVDMKTFLKNFIQSKPGVVRNEDGEIIGTHDGAEFITLGQRGGFSITAKTAHGPAHYVIGKDIASNTIIVSPEVISSNAQQSELSLRDTNWSLNIETGKEYQCELRYHGSPIPCKIIEKGTTNSATVSLANLSLVAKGQSLVLYDNSVCLGGGLIS